MAALVLMMAGRLLVRSLSTRKKRAQNVTKGAIENEVLITMGVAGSIFSTTSAFGLEPSRLSLLMSL